MPKPSPSNIPHAADHPRLGHRPRLPRPVVRARHLPDAPGRLQHHRVLHLGPRRAVVADRRLDGGDHLQHRHAEPRHQPRARARRGQQLGVVGVPAHRHEHGVLLRAHVAALGRADRSRVLRDPLLGQAGRARARLPRRLPRPVLQHRDHGDGEPRRRQDRQRAARLADVADAGGLRGASTWRSPSIAGLWGVLVTDLIPVRHRDDRRRSPRRTTRCSSRRSAACRA